MADSSQHWIKISKPLGSSVQMSVVRSSHAAACVSGPVLVMIGGCGKNLSIIVRFVTYYWTMGEGTAIVFISINIIPIGIIWYNVYAIRVASCTGISCEATCGTGIYSEDIPLYFEEKSEIFTEIRILYIIAEPLFIVLETTPNQRV